MSIAQRPNFFLLLELRPDARWDPVLFEKTLREKRSAWSRQSAGVAKKALVAQQNLALIPLIREVMTDHETRAKEAAAARKALASMRQEEHARFEQQLAFLNARETLEEEEFTTFVTAFQHLVSKEEIVSRLQATIATPSPSDFPTPRVLDPYLTSAIDDRLRFLHMRTLYELLALPRTTSTQELHRAAQHLYARLVLQPPTAEVTAQIELAGFARSVFSSEEVRSRYDTRLREQSLSRLLNDLDESMSRSPNKELHHGQVMVFLEQTHRGGWPEQEALECLKEHARLRKWTMTIPMLSAERQHLCCPNCEQLNTSDQRYCTRCKQELVIDCPACRQPVSCEAISCGQCGFAAGNRYLVDHLLETLQEALKSDDVIRAEELLQEVSQAWPAPASDPRTQQLNALKERLQQLAQERDQAQLEAATLHERLKIEDHQISSGRQIYITWQQPAAGSVVILRSTCDLGQQGQVLPEAQAQKVGEWLAKGACFTTDQWRSGEVIFYTPVILLQQQAFFGASLPYVCVEKISHLTCQHLGATLRLRWRWPDSIQEALVSYHSQNWPLHNAPGITTYHVWRAEYERQGYYDLCDVSGEPLYIVVSSLVVGESGPRLSRDERLIALGTSRAVLAYDLKPATLLSNKRVLQLAIDPPRPLPALLLIKKRGGLPLSKTDGSLLCRIEATCVSRNTVNFDLPEPLLLPGMFAKIFLEDDSAYAEIIVHHPSKERLRLR